MENDCSSSMLHKERRELREVIVYLSFSREGGSFSEKLSRIIWHVVIPLCRHYCHRPKILSYNIFNELQYFYQKRTKFHWIISIYLVKQRNNWLFRIFNLSPRALSINPSHPQIKHQTLKKTNPKTQSEWLFYQGDICLKSKKVPMCSYLWIDFKYGYPTRVIKIKLNFKKFNFAKTDSMIQ